MARKVQFRSWNWPPRMMRRISQLKAADCSRLRKGSTRGRRQGVTKSAPPSISASTCSSSSGSICMYCGEVMITRPRARSAAAVRHMDSPNGFWKAIACRRAP